MKISTRTRYAMRAMVDLAENESNGPLQIRVIAERQDMSIKYLEQLMAILKSAGFIKSVRGAKGGYVLAIAADQIKLSDIFRVLEGKINTTECVENENCCLRTTDCAVRRVWQQMEMAIEDVLKAITLQDMADRTKKTNSLNYQI